MKKNIIKLSESQLKKIVTESVKRILNEDTHEGYGWIYFNNYDVLVDQLLENGTLDSESAEKLYSDLRDIFDVITVKGRFTSWYYPQTSWEPADYGCELEEITNYDEIIDKIQKLQWPTQIVNMAQEFFEAWAEKQIGSDGDGWEFDEPGEDNWYDD